MLVILVLTRRIADAPVETRPKFDLVGAVLSASGLALLVFGILRSGEWGWIRPNEGGPSWAHLSPTVWLVLAGLFVIYLFFNWETRREAEGQRAAGQPRDAPEQAADRRPDDVLLPVPRPGGLLLRRAALPLGLPGPVRARDRRPAAAALGHAARRGDRDPALLAAGVSAAGGALRPARAAGRNGRPARHAGRRRGPGDRLRAHAADRPRHRRARLAARQPSRSPRFPTTRLPRSAASRTR